ncbi:DUF6896 domain-containing protein [Hymenobacter lucidus]|uniref:DUF6896 domain-containing protein n=1 Tax=Hymenobacter lucidus TaxID=2880930 RepID=A0ABS8AWW9_9BACT|nr:hypothetical protein [Hymenobacter lucidus]MCB2410294.1 hypothetical protein [Hymenobacter lucidus]
MPQPEELVELLREYREVGIRYTALPDGYLDALADTLEYHTFMHWLAASGGVIIITPAVSTQSIIARKDAIYDCAKEFRRQAIYLIGLLYDTFEIPQNQRNDLQSLWLIKGTQPQGQVNREWRYYFHGYECRFENTKTRQVVEAVIINCPEFGCLTAFFFLEYINTTKQFIELRQWFDNKESNATKALTILGKQGVLKQLASARDDRNLFAD